MRCRDGQHDKTHALHVPEKLLSKTTLDNITIQDITDDAEVSRKTFYYHFQDIYDLLDWTLQEDARHLVANKINLDNWEESIAALFVYMQENRMLVLNAFHSLERDTLEKEVFKLLSPLLHRLFSAQEGFDRLSEADQNFIVSVYGLGITGLFLRWIGANMMSPPEPMIRQLYRLMGGSLQGIVQRFLTTADTE
ncbi:MAG: TetR/AcrR family transcriptional regulator C-terminal domain-containing protein [Christensenellales bacterium]